MIDFATLQGLAIPEGVVTKIADAAGRVLWKLNTSAPVILEVAKVTATTYAGETTYENEEFILLDIYPKSGGTVNITYGGLTKTVTDTSGAEEPNAISVFFGTYNGVSDSVTTPTSGTLTIDGDLQSFGNGTYTGAATKDDGNLHYASCITAITDWGEPTGIPAHGFRDCPFVGSLIVPEGVTNIGDKAFYNCKSLTHITLPSTLKTIGKGVAFCQGNASVLLTIKVLATTPPTWEEDGSDTMGLLYAAQGGKNVIIVPKGCLDAYKAAPGWSRYATYNSSDQTVTMKEAD